MSSTAPAREPLFTPRFLGLWAYARARRQGLLRSRCVLGDTRLVMAYLGAAGVLGLVFIVRDIIR